LLRIISTIVPWNYPHLCIVNSVLPALIAGNSVIIKPAPQAPVPAERVLSTFIAAGLPPNVLQVIHLDQETTLNSFVPDPRIDFVAFTGSVVGGRAVQEAAAKGKGFKGVGLELGGKDPAYVRQDADITFAVENLVDGEPRGFVSEALLLRPAGAMFNSGQSCKSDRHLVGRKALTF
jgi:acyl-CoA reductase-like NAD-dependent aldehyde dehydrogenase